MRLSLFARFGRASLLAASTLGLVAPAFGADAKVAVPQRFVVENQWGGDAAPWRPGGTWTIGGRATQGVTEVKIASKDGGKTFTGTMKYAGEGSIGFRAKANGFNAYAVENQWGGANAKWHKGGSWVLGGRSEQALVSLDIVSKDGGRTFTGTATYAGEGPIGFRASPIKTEAAAGQPPPPPVPAKFMGFTYVVQNRWGGENAAWNPGGTFLLGGRPGQFPVAIDVTSKDGGRSFEGSVTYQGEGPISFRATETEANLYRAEVQWGGAQAKWNEDGVWKLGGRNGQKPVRLKIASSDGGLSWKGTMTYEKEGPIDVRADSADGK